MERAPLIIESHPPLQRLSKQSQDAEEIARAEIKSEREAQEFDFEAPLRLTYPDFETTEDDIFLLKLNDDENLTWEEIASRFKTDMGKQLQIPALQMRLKRLRERMRAWTENDVHALKLAHESWLSQNFEIIAQKVTSPSNSS